MKKRGQFYIIATLIIIGVIMGLVFVYNSANAPKKDATLNDLTKEMNYEINRAVDNGFYNNLEETTINQNINILTDYYAGSNPDTYFLIIYGNASELTFTTYNNPAETIEISHGGIIVLSSSGENKLNSTTRRSNAGTEIAFEDTTIKSIELNPGRTLFILAKKEKGGERFISTSND